MADVLKKVPVREQAPKVRATNFEEVCLGYNKEEAMEEANRCLGCKKAKCMEGCPVSINIPGFVHEVKEGNFEKAYQIIGESSALPAVCGRVCPQETQCEGKMYPRSERARLFPSVSWSVSLLTGRRRTASSQFRQHRRTDTR